MKCTNEIKLVLDARSVNESYSRIAAAALVSQLDPTIDVVADVKTAVSECVTNSIVHGYRNTTGKIYITMRLLEGGLFQVRIQDKGCGIADIEAARTPCFTTAPGEERSGMGFSIMETFMDKIRVHSKEGKGTVVTMWKNIV